MQRNILIIVIQLTVLQLFGQNNPGFYPPLKIPIVLSGNFGEIRSDHFHSGIDIKTQGTKGHHVFAIDKGYVSRIKVQANGYGKSIYLAHPNGHTSLYGHLDRYREDIADYVKKIQYQRQSHQVDIYLDPETFKVSQGEFIAYSGNSGGSSGPHLHFEVRNSGNQHPTNVLQYGFDIRDETAPRFRSLFIRPRGKGGHVNGSSDNMAFDLVIDGGTYMVPWGTRVEAGGEIGIGVEVFDYLDGAANRCGIHTLEMFVDEQRVYGLRMDEFSFSETRYVNAHIDYREKVSTGKIIHRLYRLPNDRLRIYSQLENDGLLPVVQQRDYPVRIVATDVAGNSSTLLFTIQGKPGEPVDTGSQENPGHLMKCNVDNVFETGDMKVEIPANALYEDLHFQYSAGEKTAAVLSEFHRIHKPEVPVHRSYTLMVKAPEVPAELHSKLIIVAHDEEEDKIIAAGGEYNQGYVVTSLRSFGSYAVALDTLAPEISPRNGSESGNQEGNKTIRFTIRDDLSGIEKYEGYIDNRWALFEYDPKNELLTYYFDQERIEKGKEHELELYVSDAKGNVNLYHTMFNW